jgi:uncharacterized protein YkwD
MPPTAPPLEKYSQVAELEKVMFGIPQPNIPLEYRLDRLESEVFHQTNPEWDAQRRIDRLKSILLGTGAPPSAVAGERGLSPAPAVDYPTANSPYVPSYGQPATAAPYMTPANPYLPPSLGNVPLDVAPGTPPPPEQYLPLPAEASSPSFTKQASRDELEQYALQLVNDMRSSQGLQPLEWDATAHKLARSLVADLCRRNTVSHQDAAGNNPDVRYTREGGTDCLVESLACLKTKALPTPNKALVYSILKELISHQDDRDSLLSPHASHFAFSFDVSNAHDKLLACAETVTRAADVEPIPAEVHVGDKVPVKGIIKGPYRFYKITIAWEGTPPPDDSQDQDEAMPYFPPLDYEAYARKSEHDWSKQQRILQIAGIGAALAASVFVPPVALAAPLIASAGGTARPKPISEIPVRGGVHVDGPAFEHTVALSKDNKEGIYYITVWAQSEADQQPFAVSRRAVMARGGNTAESQQGKATSKEVPDRDLLTAENGKRDQKREKNAN